MHSDAKNKLDQDLECPENLNDQMVGSDSGQAVNDDDFQDSVNDGSSQYEDIENDGQYLDEEERQEEYDASNANI